MHKVLAEIIAGVIPHKMTRNQWRGILRFGVFNAIKLNIDIRRNHTTPEHHLAVCAIAKNEGPYFKEWVEWHLSQGVDKFYVYDNGSTDSTRSILAPYIDAGIVDYKPFPGHRMQLAAYDDCLSHHRYEARWIAFIDIDEFIVPLKHHNLPALLQELEDYPAVELNWLVYGSSGRQTRSEGTVMQRFKRHALPQHPVNRHVKSIVNPRRVYNMIGCHEAARINGYAVDPAGRPVRRHFRDREPQLDIARINHYAVKSLEEFAEKQARGRASGTVRSLSLDYFHYYDLNDVAEE